jgi:hypothetical protein
MFFEGSRYENVPEAEWTAPDGRVVRYKLVRAIPSPEPRRFHAVAAGERLDHLAFLHFRDAERMWRLADANDAMWPNDLLEPVGSVIRVPDPEG